MRTTTKIGVLAALAVLPQAGAAQRTCGAGGEAGTLVPDLGFTTISCSHCSMEFDDDGPRRYDFRAEPRIGGISDVGGGKLREGDVLVSIDGRLITTREAAERMVRVRRGEVVRLGVRRDGRVHDVTVRAGEYCMPTPRAPRPPRIPPPPKMPAAPPVPGAPRVPPVPPAPGIPAPPRAPTAPEAPPAPGRPPVPPVPPVPPAPVEIFPDGWFGFGISCEDCGVRRLRGGESSFFFSEPPVVQNVEPGSPAARAGMRRGDRLTHIDGQALTTAAGARRFHSVRPGQAVTWTFRRGSQTSTARVTAVRRPDAPTAGRAPRAPTAAQRLRYSGTVGGSDVEVRGAPVTVTRDERTGELVIRSSELTVRVKPTGNR